jgi:L-rhamnose isomerase
MQDQHSLMGRVREVTEEMAGNPVVSATKERAQKAAHAAKSQLPATREDVLRLGEQLDRIETALVALTHKVDAMMKAKPRRTASTAGRTKTES